MKSYINIKPTPYRTLDIPKRLTKAIKLPKQKTAGIIGGLGPQSTALFYQTYTQYCLEQELPRFPRLILNSVDMWEVIEILKEKDMDQLLEFLYNEIEMIQDQVDFIVMVCNSVHAVLEPLRALAKVPIISIFEEVCKEVANTSYSKIGILGTKTTIDNGFYQNELSQYDIDYAILPEEETADFDHFIFEEMLHGRGKGTMKRLLLEGVNNLRKQGCDAVILGCTELPLFLHQNETDMPLFMSTQVLARTVVDSCTNAKVDLEKRYKIAS